MCFPCEKPIGGALLRFQTREFGELGYEAKPTTRMCDEVCNSRLGPYRPRSYMVSQSDRGRWASVRRRQPWELQQ